MRKRTGYLAKARRRCGITWLCSVALLGISIGPTRTMVWGQEEVVLQYFNTTWRDIAWKIPELAESGYTALWLPPPFKAGAGIYSVGFDTYDRFDLGDKDQMGTIPTKYGTREDLLHMIEMAHRFGIRVYFDNIMAHNGGPMPNTVAGVLAENGFVPEDFHILYDGNDHTYKNTDWPDWNNEWEVLHRNPFGADIAHETDAWSGGNQHNESFGWNEGDWYPKWSGVRHPNHPEYYLDTDLPVGTNSQDGTSLYTFANKEPFEDVGYGPTRIGAGNGRFDWDDVDADGQHDANETDHEPFDDLGLRPNSVLHTNTQWGFGDGIYNMGNPTAEDVNGLLMRSVRWFTDVAHVDGFRLDAVKHVPSGFFGKQTWPKDDSNWGYGGQIQEQFNITRGFSDWDNHRDTCYGDQARRDDALLFGEHLGAPPGGDGYVNAGMRMANDDLLNHVKHNIGSGLWGMDTPGFGTWGVGEAMMYVMSHDNNYLWGGDREAAYAYILHRAGLPIVYTDGYNQSGSPDWFPKPAETPFLGQFGASYMPNSLDVRRHFGRGNQYAKWQDGDYIAWIMKDETVSIPGPTMVFMMARNYGGAQTRDFNCEFPEGARLVNYSYHGGPFYANVTSGGVLRDDSSQPIYVPSGGYFAFSWRNPEMPEVWDDGIEGEVQPIAIFEDGQPVGSV